METELCGYPWMMSSFCKQGDALVGVKKKSLTINSREQIFIPGSRLGRNIIGFVFF